MPRKTELTPDVHSAIVRDLQRGAFLKHAAEKAGVSERRVHEWLVRGRADETDEPFATFAREVDEARAKDMVVNIGRVTKAGKEDWRAAAWYLERKYPREFGPTLKLEQKQRIAEDLLDVLKDRISRPAYEEVLKALADDAGIQIEADEGPGLDSGDEASGGSTH